MKLELLIALTGIFVFMSQSQSHELQINQTHICDLCQCEKTTVLCDFRKSEILLIKWDSKFFLPSDCTAIEIILRRDTKLELHDGFFHVENRVNRIIITGGSQVEVTEFAFRNNQGGYPDIQILNITNVFLRKNSFSGREFKLSIIDCQSLVLFPEAFANVNASCNFVRIDHLEINKKAFSTNSTVNLYIENAQINEIQCFAVFMKTINITKSKIGTIRKKAFDSIKINELSFEYCDIHMIETGAFTDRLSSNRVSITGCHIDTIDREAINGSGISELMLKNNTIQTIEFEALKVNSALVFIQSNIVRHSGNNWLTVTQGSQILVENNHFMYSGQVSLGHSMTGQNLNCSFSNNRLDSAQSISLNITNCLVRAIITDRSCSCNNSNVVTSFEHDFSSEIYCSLEPRDQNCFNETNVNSRRYNNEACRSMLPNRTLRCTDGSMRIWRKDYGFITKEENAKMNRGMSLEKIAQYIAGVLFAVLAVVIICYSWKYYFVKSRERNDETPKCIYSQEELAFLNAKANALNENLSLRLNLIKLIEENNRRTVSKCTEHVTQLISQTKNLPDIKIFFENHLKSHKVIMLHDGDNRPAPSAPILQNEHGDEPIYEEPQQPLLLNTYSQPLENGAMAHYEEPINPADPNDMPPPYQAEYATPMLNHQLSQSSSIQQQIPSSHTFNHNNNNTKNNNSARYATPIWRPAANFTPLSSLPIATTMPMASPPITHAQRHVRNLRQDLEAKPQFHPNQLTSIRNQRQLHLTPPVTDTGTIAAVSTAPATATIRHPQQRTNLKQNHSHLTSRQSFECLDGAASLAAMEHMDMRGAAGGCDTVSDHSGGSDETVKIDDVIEYADA